MASEVRLYVDHPLGPGQSVPLTGAQAHYLGSVMRLAPGRLVTLFNGRDGEWRAEIAGLRKVAGEARCAEPGAPQRHPPDVWLLFAPVKRGATDLIVEKAAELGIARLVPVVTDRTNSERVRTDRLRAIAVEAAEQCGATYVAEVAEAEPLPRVLAGWPEGRRLLFCDEASGRGGADAALPVLSGHSGETDPWAILAGPEGGFTEGERARLRALPFAVPVSLGPRILRAETAAIAALVLWQAILGDWR